MERGDAEGGQKLSSLLPRQTCSSSHRVRQMNHFSTRRAILKAAAATVATALVPWKARAQARPTYADMHSHMSISRGLSSYRDFMAKGNMLLVAEKVIPDGPWIRTVGNRLMAPAGKPGERRKSFDTQVARVRARASKDSLPFVTSTQSLDRVVQDATPALVLASEGADFLEGDLGYLEKTRGE